MLLHLGCSFTHMYYLLCLINHDLRYFAAKFVWSCLIHWQETAKCAGWCWLWWGERSVCKNADEFLYKLGAPSVAPRVPGEVCPGAGSGFLSEVVNLKCTGSWPTVCLFVCLPVCLFTWLSKLAYFHQVAVFIVNPIWTGFFDIPQERNPNPEPW